MNNDSDEDIPNAHPMVQVTRQGDASKMPGDLQVEVDFGLP